ncbi:hypothetical protein HK097_001120 [Rhizophlyctis rosea]|uniref:Uncharacterized protein n=1 Tax=Rhizophlyctis rosea TaxID=64517 RepID=A0AAD5X259_9FUNG|nr:hypothetical protein HK097_001120 [Rhizophlyctis rosea]
MLLDNVTPRQALQTFLDMRKRAILDQLDYKSVTKDNLTEKLCQISRMLAITIRHLVNIIHRENELPYRFEAPSGEGTEFLADSHYQFGGCGGAGGVCEEDE